MMRSSQKACGVQIGVHLLLTGLLRKGLTMEPFILYLRPSRKKEPKKTDARWIAWFRDPIKGARLPKNRISIDTLNARLHEGVCFHVSSKAEAFRIAQDALQKGVVFNYVKEEKIYLKDYIEEFWDYDRSPYIKRKLVEGSKITRSYTVKMGRAFAKHCLPHIPVGLPLDGFTVSMMDKIKNALYDVKFHVVLVLVVSAVKQDKKKHSHSCKCLRYNYFTLQISAWPYTLQAHTSIPMIVIIHAQGIKLPIRIKP